VLIVFVDAFETFVANARLTLRKKKPKKNASQSAIVIIPYKMPANGYNNFDFVACSKKNYLRLSFLWQSGIVNHSWI